MPTLIRDLRYALRMLRRAPGFTAVAALTLALGIGANTAVFTLVNAALLRRLPVPRPQELVTLTDLNANGTSFGTENDVRDMLAYSEYTAVRDQNRVFSGLLAAASYAPQTQAVWPGGGQERLEAKLVSGNYFQVLGVSAWRGRTFTAAEAVNLGANPVAVMSYAYWKQRFGLDPNALGRSVRINGHPFTVIGIAPPAFFGESVGDAPALWIPLAMSAEVWPGRDRIHDPAGVSRMMWLQAIGRLKPGVSLAQAQAGVNVIFRQLVQHQAGAASDAASRRDLLSQRLVLSGGGRGASTVRGQFSAPLLALFALVGLVLLIATANLASLLLARATARRKEIGVRLALGAGRGRLVRQLLTESVLLALLGGALGLALAQWGTRLLVGMVAADAPLPLDLRPDLRVLGFTAVLCLLAGVLFGLAPALRMARLDLNAVLQSQGRGGAAQTRTILGRLVRGGLPLGKILVIGQIALSALLLVGAGLFVRSLQKLTDVRLGFPSGRLLLFYAGGANAGYSGERAERLCQTLQERIRDLPGVRSVSFSGNGLFSHSESGLPVAVEGYTPPSGNNSGARFDMVSPDYFATTGIGIVLGRAIGAQDTATAPKVAVINQTMAAKFFPRANPLGKHITDLYPDDKGESWEIVGVAHDAKYNSLRETTPPRFYRAFTDDANDSPPTGAIFEVRTAADPATVEAAIRAVFRDLDANLSQPEFHTMDELVGQSLVSEHLMARLSVFFGGLALLLAAIGLYGVMSYGVARRTQEIGVRMALGARPAAVAGMIVRETLLVVALGLGAGVPASIAAARLIRSQLFGLQAYDAATLAAASAALAGVALLAGYLPARRASRVDPLTALRYE